MAEIIKTYRQSIGAMRFIGKKYGDDDRVNGSFRIKWGEWFENGWFSEIEKEDFKINYDWSFERYGCPRFTTPDEKGNVILDICFFAE